MCMWVVGVWGRVRRNGTVNPPRALSTQRRFVWVATAALVAVLSTAAVSSPVAAQSTDTASDEVRIVARKLSNNRIEFGLQQRQADDSWGDRRLPSSRFFPADVAVGRWLRSSPLTIGVAATSSRSATEVVVRIVARKIADGRVEFALRKQISGDTYSGPLLPRARLFPTTATVGRWLQSTPISVITTQPTATTTPTTTPTTPPASGYTALAAGWDHVCALDTDGDVACTGDSGNDKTNAPDGQFIALDAGPSHSCGIRTTGTIVCWGLNNLGQTDAPSGQFTDVSVGNANSCALRTDNTITCWGLNHAGQGNAPSGEFTVVTAGHFDHACGLRADGTVTCWGTNDDGQTNAPDGQFTTVAAGYIHSCGLRADGAITCWGNNDNGQTNAPDGQFTTIVAGAHHSCGLRTNNTVACWGWNANGQTAAPLDVTFSTLAAGFRYSCGVQLTDGIIGCWGRTPQADGA